MNKPQGFRGSAFAVALALGLPALAVGGPRDVDSLVLDQLRTQGRADIFVKMTSDASLAGAESVGTRAARSQYVYDVLSAHAAQSQQGVRSYLDQRAIGYQVFWINNSLLIRGASRDLVIHIERIALPVRRDCRGPVFSQNAGQPVESCTVDLERVVTIVQELDGGAQHPGCFIRLNAASRPCPVFVTRWCARPVVLRFATFSEREIHHVNVHARTSRECNGSASAGTEIGGMSAEDDDAALACR